MHIGTKHKCDHLKDEHLKKQHSDKNPLTQQFAENGWSGIFILGTLFSLLLVGIYISLLTI